MTTRILRHLPILGAIALGGCTNPDLVGHYWNVTIVGLSDGCTDSPAAQYSEKAEYRVKIDGQDIEVAVGPDVFATGSINGCNIQYESVIWGEEIDGVEVRWQLYGSATINLGEGSCQPGNGTDWDGTEIFEVVNSESPEISPGCEYQVGLSGKYTGETK